jgi:PAS domain-containing protein
MADKKTITSALALKNSQAIRAEMDIDTTNRKLAKEVLRQGSDELEARVEERILRLHESEERFKDFVEIGSDWLWEMDADFRYSYFSTSYEPHSGVSTESAAGRTRAELYVDILPSLSKLMRLFVNATRNGSAQMEKFSILPLVGSPFLIRTVNLKVTGVWEQTSLSGG